jgi:hypothetical protein
MPVAVCLAHSEALSSSQFNKRTYSVNGLLSM